MLHFFFHVHALATHIFRCPSVTSQKMPCMLVQCGVSACCIAATSAAAAVIVFVVGLCLFVSVPIGNLIAVRYDCNACTAHTKRCGRTKPAYTRVEVVDHMRSL